MFCLLGYDIWAVFTFCSNYEWNPCLRTVSEFCKILCIVSLFFTQICQNIMQYACTYASRHEIWWFWVIFTSFCMCFQKYQSIQIFQIFAKKRAIFPMLSDVLSILEVLDHPATKTTGCFGILELFAIIRNAPYVWRAGPWPLKLGLKVSGSNVD